MIDPLTLAALVAIPFLEMPEPSYPPVAQAAQPRTDLCFVGDSMQMSLDVLGYELAMFGDVAPSGENFAIWVNRDGDWWQVVTLDSGMRCLLFFGNNFRQGW